MNEPPAANPSEALQLLCDQFRNTSHDINNAFAVLLAMAELAEHNSANYERLGKAVLERCPKIVHEIQSFQSALFAARERFSAPS